MIHIHRNTATVNNIITVKSQTIKQYFFIVQNIHADTGLQPLLEISPNHCLAGIIYYLWLCCFPSSFKPEYLFAQYGLQRVKYHHLQRTDAAQAEQRFLSVLSFSFLSLSKSAHMALFSSRHFLPLIVAQRRIPARKMDIMINDKNLAYTAGDRMG